MDYQVPLNHREFPDQNITEIDHVLQSYVHNHRSDHFDFYQREIQHKNKVNLWVEWILMFENVNYFIEEVFYLLTTLIHFQVKLYENTLELNLLDQLELECIQYTYVVINEDF